MEKDCSALWNRAKELLGKALEKRWTLFKLKDGAFDKWMRKGSWALGTAGARVRARGVVVDEAVKSCQGQNKWNLVWHQFDSDSWESTGTRLLGKGNENY